jgi:phosphoglycolate phosphatase
VIRKLILFDIDGTILLTAGAGRRALVAALAGEVSDTSGFDQVRFDGKTDPQIVAELLEAAGDPEPRESRRVRAVCRR